MNVIHTALINKNILFMGDHVVRAKDQESAVTFFNCLMAREADPFHWGSDIKQVSEITVQFPGDVRVSFEDYENVEAAMDLYCGRPSKNAVTDDPDPDHAKKINDMLNEILEMVSVDRKEPEWALTRVPSGRVVASHVPTGENYDFGGENVNLMFVKNLNAGMEPCIAMENRCKVTFGFQDTEKDVVDVGLNNYASIRRYSNHFGVTQPFAFKVSKTIVVQAKTLEEARDQLMDENPELRTAQGQTTLNTWHL